MLGLLLAAVVASYLVGEPNDAIIIGLIIVVSVGLGFVNEYRAEKAAEALLFTGPRRSGRRPTLDCLPKTKVVTRDTDVTINVFVKHSRVKQHLKDGRALRIETVVNSPNDLRCQRWLRNLDQLQAKAREVNARLLATERVGQGCVLASPA